MTNQFLLLFYYFLIMVPPLLAVILFLKLDKFPEPIDKIIVTILLAYAGTSIMGTIKYDVLMIPAEWTSNNFINAYILVALPEEMVKFLVLYFYCTKLPEFNEQMDGIIYGGLAGLGFAINEAFQYLGNTVYEQMQEYGSSGAGQGFSEIIYTIFTRGFFAVPGHIFDGVIMGAIISICIFKPVNKLLFIALALIIPTITHGTWDYILFAEYDIMFFALLYGILLALVTGLFVHFRGLQRTKFAESERKFN